MIGNLFIDALIDAALEKARENGETDILQGAEIIKKICGLHDDLGNKLHKVPHENYPEILCHLEAIEELFKSEE